MFYEIKLYFGNTINVQLCLQRQTFPLLCETQKSFINQREDYNYGNKFYMGKIISPEIALRYIETEPFDSDVNVLQSFLSNNGFYIKKEENFFP